ncbi:serine/threonine-protein kinase [Streptomyces sp. CA-294286]|uniref:serine/threonine-protein kinase n=1 Tax=Streptomyces sp. CA-294286 TaxID=3240070 RepID=UPI003D8BEF81
MHQGAAAGGQFHPLEDNDPQTVASYRIAARLGAGGMGQVYLSYTPGGHPIAIKIIRPELGEDPGFRQRFRLEVQAAQRVQGLYTAPVIDFDTEGGRPWLATAYVAGPSLAVAVAEHGKLPVAAVLRLLAGMAEALKVIHDAGIVHRDLKPANVLLGADGPKVIDFGIARAADATALTGTGVTVGTPAFMSPEQAAGRELGPPSDIFALGQVGVYAAVGNQAYGQGNSHAVLYRIVHEEPDLTGLPEELGFLARCLAKDPAQRPTPAEIIECCRAASAEPLSQRGSWLPEVMEEDIDRRTRAWAAMRTSMSATAEGAAGSETGKASPQNVPGGPDASGGRDESASAGSAPADPVSPGGNGTPSGPGGHGGYGTPSGPGTPGTPAGPVPYPLTAPGDSHAPTASAASPVGPATSPPPAAPGMPPAPPGGPATPPPYPGSYPGQPSQPTAVPYPGPGGPGHPTHPTHTPQHSLHAAPYPMQPQASWAPPPPKKKMSGGVVALIVVAAVLLPVGGCAAYLVSLTDNLTDDSKRDRSSSSAGSTGGASGKPRPDPKPVTYKGVNLTNDYYVRFSDSPPRPIHSGDAAYEADSDFYYWSDERYLGSRSKKISLLNNSQQGSLRTCRDETRFTERLTLSQVSPGSQICVHTKAGHIALVTYRGRSSASDPSDYVTLDLTLWRNAEEPASSGY